MTDEPTPELEQMRTDLEIALSSATDVLKSLNEAIDSVRKNRTSRADFMMEQVRALEKARALVPDAIEKVAVARGSGHVAAYHVPSVNMAKDEIVAGVKQIASLEKQLLKLDTAAQKEIDGKQERMDDQYLAEDEYREVVAKMSKSARDMFELQAGLRLALDTTFENARKHVQRRDASGLELDWSDADEISLKSFEDGVRALSVLHERAKVLNHEVGMNVRTELMTDFGVPHHRCEQFEKDLPYLKERKKAIKAMKVVPLDIAKAMKTLGVPPAHKAALAKALEGDDARCTKALDELAKKAKLDKSGKQMMASLRDAKVLV